MRKKKMKKELILIAAIIISVICIFFNAAFSQGIPKVMHHSGRLIDPGTGQPYPPGKYYLRFLIIDPVAKQTLWQYSLWMSIKQDNIEAEYEVLLGKYNPILLPFDEGYILRVIELTSGPPGTIVENRALSSVGYAYRSEFTNYADMVFDSSNNSYKDVKNIKVAEADNANTLDGKDAVEFGDTHSLDAADGDPVDAVYVDNAGNVGIGTTSPQNNLHIYEDKNGFVGLKINNPNTGSNSSEGIYFTNEDGDVAGINLYDEGFVYSGQMSIFNNRPGGSIGFGTGGSIKMTLQNSGNVGIGTASPSAKLDVVGTIEATSYTYASVQTRYFTIPGAGFSGDTDENFTKVVNFARPNTTAGETNLYGAVHLPHGSTITGLTAYVYDIDASNLSVYLYANNVTNGNSNLVAVLNSSGTSGEQTLTTTISYAVDNSTRAFLCRLRFYPPSSIDNLKVYSVVIKYTITTPLS